MKDSFSKIRPTFYQFRDCFIEVIQKETRNEVSDPFMHWQEVGSETMRAAILESFMQSLETKYDFRPVFQENLVMFDGSIESMANRIFHVFSTMFLVDHINAKAYKQKTMDKH